MADFIFKLGPMDRPGGDFFTYYVYPGRGEGDAYPAPNDEVAFGNILEDHRSDELRCEPQLAAAGERHGVASSDFDRLSSHGLAYAAYGYFPGRPFSAVTRQGLVYHFAMAIKELLEHHGSLSRYGGRAFNLEVLGTVAFETTAFFHDAGPTGQLFTILMEKPKEPIEQLQRDTGLLRRYGHLRADVCDEPEFVLDAMKRAHGLPTIPVAATFRDGRVFNVDDTQLAIVSSSISAASRLRDDSRVATCRIELAGLEIVTNIVPR